MSHKAYKQIKTFSAPTTGAVLHLVDEAEYLNFLSFHVLCTTVGGSVNVDLTVEQSNDPSDSASWKATSITKNYNAAASNNDLLEVAWASAKAYRLVLTIAAGTVSTLKVMVCGKG
jgi:hypothetical protein